MTRKKRKERDGLVPPLHNTKENFNKNTNCSIYYNINWFGVCSIYISYVAAVEFMRTKGPEAHQYERGVDFCQGLLRLTYAVKNQCARQHLKFTCGKLISVHILVVYQKNIYISCTILLENGIIFVTCIVVFRSGGIGKFTYTPLQNFSPLKITGVGRQVFWRDRTQGWTFWKLTDTWCTPIIW